MQCSRNNGFAFNFDGSGTIVTALSLRRTQRMSLLFFAGARGRGGSGSYTVHANLLK